MGATGAKDAVELRFLNRLLQHFGDDGNLGRKYQIATNFATGIWKIPFSKDQNHKFEMAEIDMTVKHP